MDEKITGVNKLKNGKWRVVYRRKTLGYFASYDEAVAERKRAERNDQPKTEDDKSKVYFDKCYDLVKLLYGYDENQALTRFTVLRLRGIVNGKFAANKNTLNNANYSYDTLYYTIVACSDSIKYALKSNNFKDESHITNYVFKIIENKINDVYLRMKNAEVNKNTIDNIDMSATNEKRASYNSQSKVESNKFDDLW